MRIGISWLDFKLGVRMLVKYPGLTLVGTLAIAVTIAIGAGILEWAGDWLHPTLPLQDGERIVGIRNWDGEAADPEFQALHDFVVWREELETIEDLGAFRTIERNLITGDGRSQPVDVAEISASAFRVARVAPLLGRPLVQADEREGAPPVVVIGHDVWQSRFGGDPELVGRTVRLGSATHTVVGVMPEGFGFPVSHSLWIPFQLNATDYARGEGPAIWTFGRLAPGATFEQAQAELNAIGLRTAADFPGTHEHLRPQIMPYAESFFSADPWAIYRVQFFLTLLLVVASINVATLVFARTATRDREVVVRTALGASRGRIIMQLFAEALVLASAGAVIGLTTANLGVRWVTGVFRDMGFGLESLSDPFWWNDNLAPTTVLYAGMLTVLGAVIVGVVPALKVTGRRVEARLRHAAAGGPGMRFGGVWTAVIVLQVALSVAFLPTAISLGGGLLRTQSRDLEFPADEYLTARLEMDWETSPFADSAETVRFLRQFGAMYQRLEHRLVREPEVSGVTFARPLPGMGHPQRLIEVEGVSAARQEASIASVDLDFFDALSIPILSGRAFHVADVESNHEVVIANQPFVQQVLGGRNPIGRRVRYAGDGDQEPGPWYEIVGVVADLGMIEADPDEDTAAGLYRLMAPGDAYPILMAIHVGPDPSTFAPRLRSIAATVNPTLRLSSIRPLPEAGRGLQLLLRLLASVLVVLATSAVLLSMAGIYSLMSFTVAQRTREIGIRAALGARPGRIVTAIFSRAFVQLGIGTVLGGAVAALLADPVDVGMLRLLLLVAGLMFGVGLLACAVPASRALRIQPTEALTEGG